MPDYLHRTSKRLHNSTAEADLPEPVANYILDPDLSGVVNQPLKYWVINGDNVLLADQAARDVIDASELNVTRDEIAGRMDNVEDELRAVVLVLIDELNVLRALHGLSDRTPAQAKTGIRNKLGS